MKYACSTNPAKRRLGTVAPFGNLCWPALRFVGVWWQGCLSFRAKSAAERGPVSAGWSPPFSSEERASSCAKHTDTSRLPPRLGSMWGVAGAATHAPESANFAPNRDSGAGIMWQPRGTARQANYGHRWAREAGPPREESQGREEAAQHAPCTLHPVSHVPHPPPRIAVALMLRGDSGDTAKQNRPRCLPDTELTGSSDTGHRTSRPQ